MGWQEIDPKKGEEALAAPAPDLEGPGRDSPAGPARS
jgi:hypothetical protein